MSTRRSILAASALAVSLSFGPTAYAQNRRMGGNRPKQQRPEKPAKPAKTPIDEFQRMSPDEQQKALERLPPAQRQKLQERLQQFNKLPAEQQRTLKTMYSRLNDLPKERQEGVRQSMNKFVQEPPERQQAMRDELKGMAAMSATDRSAHMSSPDFKSKFNKKEQDMVRDMSELLPPK